MIVPTLTFAEPPPPLEAFGYTHPGRQRDENEDTFGASPDVRLFTVADGMGGRTGGAVAARLAVDQIEGFVRGRHADPRAGWPFPMDPQAPLGANMLRVGFQVANQKIRVASDVEAGPHRRGATCASLMIGHTRLVAAHVGDVRLYRLRSGNLRALTRDHSLFEEMLAASPAAEGENRPTAAHRNVVTRALGIREEVEPTVYTNSFASGDLYLLCSDGLWSQVDDARIAAVLTAYPDLEAACQILVDDANQAGGADNVTTLLVRVR